MNTDREIIKGLWGYYQNFYNSNPDRDLRIMEAKEKSLEEKSLEFKKNITKKRRRK